MKLTALFLKSCLAGALVSIGTVRANDLLIVRLAEGDTPETLAERYLGSAENSRELLQYNGYEDETVLKPGTRLLVPLNVRNEALKQLSSAERAMAVCQDEMADQYAPAQYEAAATTYRLAVQYRKNLDYVRSAGLGRLCVLQCEDAVAEASHNATIRQRINLASLQGLVELSPDGQDWQVATTNDLLQVGHLLRTGPDSRAELNLPDGTELRLLASTKLAMTELLLDRRNGVRTSEIALHGGELRASLPPAEQGNSSFLLTTPHARLDLGGSEVRVDVPSRETTRLSVLAGESSITADGRTVVVPAGQGTLVRGNRDPERPHRLLPPPVFPAGTPDELTTPLQQFRVSWLPVDDRDLGAYRIDLSRDPRFRTTLLSTRSASTEVTTPLLAEGTYYWRVAAVDDDGLTGPFSAQRQITVRKVMDVTLAAESHVWPHEGQSVVAGGNRFVIQPAQDPSSVVTMEVRLNGGDYQRTGEFTLAESGTYQMDVRGVAADGQPGPSVSYTYVADVDAPVLRVKHEVVEGGDWVDVSATAEDAFGVNRIQFRINQGPWFQYLNPFRLSNAQPALVEMQAIDLFGNRTELQPLSIGPNPL